MEKDVRKSAQHSGHMKRVYPLKNNVHIKIRATASPSLPFPHATHPLVHAAEITARALALSLHRTSQSISVLTARRCAVLSPSITATSPPWKRPCLGGSSGCPPAWHPRSRRARRPQHPDRSPAPWRAPTCSTRRQGHVHVVKDGCVSSRTVRL